MGVAVGVGGRSGDQRDRAAAAGFFGGGGVLLLVVGLGFRLGARLVHVERRDAGQLRELLAQPGRELGGAQPGGGALCQALDQELPELVGDAGKRYDRLRDVAAQDGTGVSAAEGREAGEEFVQDRGEGVDVDGGARRQPLDYLGGQVVRRADDLGGLGAARGVDQLGHTEVGEQRRVRAAGAERALHVEQDVLRLDVAVDHSGGVCGGEAVGDVGDDRHGGLGGETAFAVETGAQVGAAHQVHDQCQVVAVHHEVADGDDMGMIETEQGGALLDEAADEFLVGRQVLAEQLDGHRALGPLAEPDRAGAAAPQDLVCGVPAADIPCQDCSLSGWRWTVAHDPRSTKLRVGRGLSARDGANLHFRGRYAVETGPRKSI